MECTCTVIATGVIFVVITVIAVTVFGLFVLFVLLMFLVFLVFFVLLWLLGNVRCRSEPQGSLIQGDKMVDYIPNVNSIPG